MNATNKEDLAGEKYWTEFWKQQKLPSKISLDSSDINNYPFQLLDDFFFDLFKNHPTSTMSVLEIGCGNSIFLGYFYERFNFKIFGLDYSEVGCQRTMEIFERDKVPGKVFLEDALNPSEELLGKFDVVVSLGVIEHFEDTTQTIYQFSRFLKPNGILITSIPNLCGLTGFLQKHLNKPVYDIHKIMDKNELNNYISNAGLTTLSNKYFLNVSCAVTLEGLNGQKVNNLFLKKIIVKSIRYFFKIIWMLEKAGLKIPENKKLSAGVINAAIKSH
jgi:2-polyprenyl-3-methyl-5-hydroxy-6-metoxy-1,4-benzoquinol methylase